MDYCRYMYLKHESTAQSEKEIGLQRHLDTLQTVKNNFRAFQTCDVKLDLQRDVQSWLKVSWAKVCVQLYLNVECFNHARVVWAHIQGTFGIVCIIQHLANSPQVSHKQR